jgi:hypothetical protein
MNKKGKKKSFCVVFAFEPSSPDHNYVNGDPCRSEVFEMICGKLFEGK